MYVLIALAVMGLAGDPDSEQFEGWTPQKSELSAGEVRVVDLDALDASRLGLRADLAYGVEYLARQQVRRPGGRALRACCNGND